MLQPTTDPGDRGLMECPVPAAHCRTPLPAPAPRLRQPFLPVSMHTDAGRGSWRMEEAVCRDRTQDNGAVEVRRAVVKQFR